MSKESIKIYKFGKTATIIGLILLLSISIGVIVIIIIYPSVGAFFALGMVFLMVASAVLYILFRSLFVKFDAESITELNAFGKIKKSHPLTELKKILIKHETARNMLGDYLCFIFSEKDYSNYGCYDLLSEDDVTILEYTKKNEKLIKNYTDVQITDLRIKKRKRE